KPWPSSSFGARRINNRLPILRSFDLRRSANRLSQSRGHFSVTPPNSSISFRESSNDGHAISSCSRWRSDLEMTTSLPPDRVCKRFSCALSQRGSASLRHRCIVSTAAEEARLDLSNHEPLASFPSSCGTLCHAHMNASSLQHQNRTAKETYLMRRLFSERTARPLPTRIVGPDNVHPRCARQPYLARIFYRPRLN